MCSLKLAVLQGERVVASAVTSVKMNILPAPISPLPDSRLLRLGSVSVPVLVK